MKNTTFYFVRYKPTGIDKWWDWSHWDTPEDAIMAFKANAQRAHGAREAHLVRQTTMVNEEFVQMVG